MSFATAIVVGAVLGVALMALLVRAMKWREAKRAEKARAVTALDRINLDGIRKILEDKTPTYLIFEQFERVEWLNVQLREIWQYVSKATSETIRASVEPKLDEYRPVGVQSIKFSKFSLGNVSARIEGVDVHMTQESQVIMDLDFFWGGDPSIILQITALAAKLQVQLKDLEFRATLRLIFQLGNELPCISAIVLSMLAKPKMFIQYELKAIGGNLTAIPGLAGQIDDMIRGAIESTLQWPQRMVIPIATGYDTSHLELRYTGCLRVVVGRGQGLKNVDLMGKSDPYVILWLRTGHKFKTRVIDNNLNPVWNETFEIPVDDVHTAELILQVKDEGVVNNESLGMASIPLSKVIAESNRLACTLELLPELGNDRLVGPFGLGSISLELSYRKYMDEEIIDITEKEKKHDAKVKDMCMTKEEIAASDAAAEVARKRAAGNFFGNVGQALSAFKGGINKGSGNTKEAPAVAPVAPAVAVAAVAATAAVGTAAAIAQPTTDATKESPTPVPPPALTQPPIPENSPLLSSGSPSQNSESRDFKILTDKTSPPRDFGEGGNAGGSSTPRRHSGIFHSRKHSESPGGTPRGEGEEHDSLGHRVEERLEKVKSGAGKVMSSLGGAVGSLTRRVKGSHGEH